MTFFIYMKVRIMWYIYTPCGMIRNEKNIFNGLFVLQVKELLGDHYYSYDEALK